MALLFGNNCSSTLNGAITSSATTILIQTNDAVTWPTPVAAVDYFMITLEDKSQNPVAREIVKCTQRIGNSLTVIRAQETTTALNFNNGIVAECRLTAGMLQSMMATAGVGVGVSLFLGAFSSAPSTGVNGVPLTPGNLYYNTVSRQLFDFDGAFWDAVQPAQQTLAFGQYLGTYASPPAVGLNGQSLLVGDLYYDTTQGALFEWNGNSWANAATVTINVAPTSSSNTSQGLGVFQDITVLNTSQLEGPVYYEGELLVSAGDLSGSPFSQRLPDGNLFQWGLGISSGAAIATPVTFPTQLNGIPSCVLAIPYHPPVNVTCSIGNSDAGGFSVNIEDTNNDPVGIPCSFFWLAIGPA